MADTMVAVLVYDGVEVIDMNGPIDVFIKANRFVEKKYRVFTVAEQAGDIASEGAAVRIKPEFTTANCPKPDIIVIPGQIMPAGSTMAFGTGSAALRGWLNEHADAGATILSVCVGTYILATTGLLTGRKATTHFQAIARLQEDYAKIEFVKNVRYVPDGNIITTGGVTSGIDGALYLVEQRNGADVAKKIAKIMVYDRAAVLPPDTILH